MASAHPFSEASRFARVNVQRAQIDTDHFTTATHPHAPHVIGTVGPNDESGEVTALVLNRHASEVYDRMRNAM